MLVRIVAPYFVAGLVFERYKDYPMPVVARCAPIVTWLQGYTLIQVKKECEKRGWKIRRVPVVTSTKSGIRVG
jgi:hypothetical protein